MKLLGLVWVIFLVVSPPVFAHEVRPAYLLLEEQPEQVFSVLWKVPAKGGVGPALQLVLPDSCQRKSNPLDELRDGSYIRNWEITCTPEGLEGQLVTVDGLSTTLIDVIVRVEWLDGQSFQTLLTPDQTEAVIGERREVPQLYHFFPIGIKHILTGFDHLTFVFCLLLFVRRFMPLLKTITAFTAAHSLTLFMVSLGLLTVPAAPVEVMIAFSIALLAAEVLDKKVGSVPSGWKIAFVFGLLHGLGFAGALQQIGLPPDDIVSALLLFNLGVEAGQVAFVLVVLICLWGLERIWPKGLPRIERFATYAVGITAAFWVFERLAGFAVAG